MRGRCPPCPRHLGTLVNRLLYCHTRPILESQPSWKSLTSLSLQDGPQSGIIISLVPTLPPNMWPQLKYMWLQLQYMWLQLQYMWLQLHICGCSSTPNSLCLLTGISQQVLVGSSQNLKLKHRGPNGNRNLLEMNKTSNGRRPQNIDSGISQQPLIGSSSNLKLKLWGRNKKEKLIVIKTALNGRRPKKY